MKFRIECLPDRIVITTPDWPIDHKLRQALLSRKLYYEKHWTGKPVEIPQLGAQSTFFGILVLLVQRWFGKVGVNQLQ